MFGCSLALDHAQRSRFAIFSAIEAMQFWQVQQALWHKLAWTGVPSHTPGRPGFFLPTRQQTSHCLFSDSNPAYRLRVFFPPGRSCRVISWESTQPTRAGANPNDCSMLIGHLGHLGTRHSSILRLGGAPFVFTSDPTPVLRRLSGSSNRPRRRRRRNRSHRGSRGTTAKRRERGPSECSSGSLGW
jgi:hypothetical protein